MKQSIITLLVVGGMGFGYYELRGMRLGFSVARGQKRVVSRGDLTIPITATGVVGPLAWYEVKSEASGEVIEILFEPGELVKKKDLMIRLDESNEQRSVDRATDEVNRTKANLEMTKIKKTRLEALTRVKAEALVEQLTARLERANFSLQKYEALLAENRASPEEMVIAGSNARDAQAQLTSAHADLDDVKPQVAIADEEIALAEAAYNQAVSALGDAKERLDETSIYAPVDGMVVKINTQVGAVIQGGKTTFMAGTVLAVVADNSKIYVRAEVDESDIGTVRDLAPARAKPGHPAVAAEIPSVETGGEVSIHVDSFQDEEFTGMIERIHPEPNSTVARVVTYQVDILLNSDNRAKLLTGMQADVEFTAQSALNVVLCPHDAIRRNEVDELGVYVPFDDPESDDPGKKFVKCRFGLDNGMYAEVLDGLEEEMEVFTVLPQKIGRDDDKD